MMLLISNSIKDVLVDRVEPLISCSTALYAHKKLDNTWYYLWKHETLMKDVWMVSYGSEINQDVFLVTQSRIAAELVYIHAIEKGLMHVDGYLV